MITLPGGSVINKNDQINYRSSTSKHSIGTVVDFKPDVGENGWIRVLDNGDYEWISVALQLQWIGEPDIPLKKQTANEPPVTSTPPPEDLMPWEEEEAF